MALTFSRATAAAEQAVAAIGALVVGFVLTERESAPHERLGFRAADFGMLQPQSCGVVIDFDLHAKLANFQDEHEGSVAGNRSRPGAVELGKLVFAQGTISAKPGACR